MDPDEFDRQRHLLNSPVGEDYSGYARYGAAMYFQSVGKMSVDLLEIYRRCCKLDNENPIELAKFEGVEVPGSITR